jgi:large subunit ribosomal protein L15
VQALADAGNTDITLETLIWAGYVRGQKSRIKLLSGGTLTSSVTLSVHAASASAKSVVEKAGGTLTIVA